MAAVALLAATPGRAGADTLDVLASSPRVDLATEIDYRIRFFTVDEVTLGARAADQVSRDRIEEGREQVARAYQRVLVSALRDDLIEQVPPIRSAIERYEGWLTFRFFPRPTRRGPAEAGNASSAAATRSPDEDPEPWTSVPVTLRFGVGRDPLRPIPALEVTRGALRASVGYVVGSDRVELDVRHPLAGALDVALSGATSPDESYIRLGLKLLF